MTCIKTLLLLRPEHYLFADLSIYCNWLERVQLGLLRCWLLCCETFVLLLLIFFFLLANWVCFSIFLWERKKNRVSLVCGASEWIPPYQEWQQMTNRKRGEGNRFIQKKQETKRVDVESVRPNIGENKHPRRSRTTRRRGSILDMTSKWRSKRRDWTMESQQGCAPDISSFSSESSWSKSTILEK